MTKVFALLFTIALFGCSAGNKQSPDVLDALKKDAIEVKGDIILQIIDTNKVSFLARVEDEKLLDEKGKQLIAEEIGSVEYTYYRVRKLNSHGKWFLCLYWDCFTNPLGGFGNASVHEYRDGK